MVQIGLMIADITIWIVTLTYILKVSWCDAFAASPSCIIWWKNGLNRSYDSRDIMILVNGDLDLYSQGQLIWHFCCWPHCHHFYKRLVKVDHIIAEIQQFLQIVTLIYIFKVRWYYAFLCWPRCHHCRRNFVKIEQG